MHKKLSDEYHQLCVDEMEAEECALRATTAIRVRWHIDAGIAKGAPSANTLETEEDLWERVTQLRQKRHAWVAKHSKRSTALGTNGNAGAAVVQSCTQETKNCDSGRQTSVGPIGSAPCAPVPERGRWFVVKPGTNTRRISVELAMDRFDEDTSIMRERRAATLIDLLKPELPPQSKARGIINGTLLGAALWAAIALLGVAIWHQFRP